NLLDSYSGLREISFARVTSKITHVGPKSRVLSLVERMAELEKPCNQIEEYGNYHHRALIQ
ncbi:hypothetical protein ACQP3D_27270, partial [Escherichia coli]